MMLTTFKDEKNIRLAIQAGAEDYLIKSTEVSSMAQKLRTFLSGSIVLDADVLKQLTQPTEREELEQLTPREKDIAVLVAQGLSNREIAEQFYISEGTVRNTLSIILEKLQLCDRTQLAIYKSKTQHPKNPQGKQCVNCYLADFLLCGIQASCPGYNAYLSLNQQPDR